MERPIPTGPRVAPLWMRLLDAARFEPDPGVAQQRIAEAEQAIAERALMLLLIGGETAEQQALADAHLALNDLKRTPTSEQSLPDRLGAF